MNQAEQMFPLMLRNGDKLDDLKRLKLENLDWNMRIEGRTLVVLGIETGLLGIRSPQETLRTIEWLIMCSGSITQKCTGGGICISVLVDGARWKKLDFAGLSAIDLVHCLRGLSLRGDISTFRDEVWKCFIRASQRGQQPRVPIHQGVADVWEKFLLATESHDLKIETADGTVTAHAQMLKEASSVVKAMLESEMKEAQTHCIEVRDIAQSSVWLFLEILYTCSTQSDPNYKTVLDTLDLAHRWQVDFVVSILAELLERKITDESFEEIAERAILKSPDALQVALRQFARDSSKVQTKLRAARLSGTAMQLFCKEDQPSTSLGQRLLL